MRTELSPESEHAINVRDAQVEVGTIVQERSACLSEIGLERGTRQLDIRRALRVMSGMEVEVALLVADAGVEVEAARHPRAVVPLALGLQN